MHLPGRKDKTPEIVERLAHLRKFRGRLPMNSKFDRQEAHNRVGANSFAPEPPKRANEFAPTDAP